MAASMSMSAIGIKTVLQCSLRSKLLQLPSPALFALPTQVIIPVRHRNKGGGGKRVKDAKIDSSKNEKFIPKAQRKKTVSATIVKEIEENRILAEAPEDNVWIRKHYSPPKYSIEEALERHKSLAQPAMLNNMNGLLFLDMKLDYSTKKKTKFMSNIRATLQLPHEFPYGKPPNILVLSKNEENFTLANSLGAKHVGPPGEILKLINSGILSLKDFEHALCTAECAAEIMPLRSLFRDKFPQRGKGNLGPNLQAMWDHFYYGYTYESQKITDVLGRLQVPLGLLEQPTQELTENFKTYIEHVAQHKSIALGPFILAITVLAPPSPEEFLIKVEDYVPGYKDEEISDAEDEVVDVAG